MRLVAERDTGSSFVQQQYTTGHLNSRLRLVRKRVVTGPKSVHPVEGSHLVRGREPPREDIGRSTAMNLTDLADRVLVMICFQVKHKAHSFRKPK